jgi:hypothetical protein
MRVVFLQKVSIEKFKSRNCSGTDLDKGIPNYGCLGFMWSHRMRIGVDKHQIRQPLFTPSHSSHTSPSHYSCQLIERQMNKFFWFYSLFIVQTMHVLDTTPWMPPIHSSMSEFIDTPLCSSHKINPLFPKFF